MLNSASLPTAICGNAVGLVPFMRLPVPIKFSEPAQAQVPVFLIRHVLTNCAPGATGESSGIVTSVMNCICAHGFCATGCGAAVGAAGAAAVGVVAGAD